MNRGSGLILNGFSLSLKYDSYIELIILMDNSILNTEINLVNRVVVRNKLNYYLVLKINSIFYTKISLINL